MATSRLLLRASRRHYRRHPAQLAFAVLGVALGVAVVLAIDLANASAARAFEVAADAVAGRATHEITAPGPGALDDALYRRLRVDLGVREAAPHVTGYVVLDPHNGRPPRTVTLLGVDPLAEAPLRPWLAFRGKGGFDVGKLLTEPGAVLLSADTARQLGLRVGNALTITAQGFEQPATLIGTLAPDDDTVARGLSATVVADVSTAQELLHREGQLDAIDLRLSDDEAGRARLAAIEHALPSDVTIEPAGARRGALRELTRAFRINLQALSLLALLVGGFLVFNAMRFAVVQRRTSLGVLRAVGATRRQVFTVVVLEAVMLGVVGTALGMLLGPLLAEALVGLVARTINDLYLTVAVRDVVLSAPAYAWALVLGLVVCTLAALAPAREATAVSPREAMTRSSAETALHAALPRTLAVAVALAVAGSALLALPSHSLVVAYAGLLLVLLAAAATVPAACAALLRAAAPLARLLLGAAGAQAARGAISSLNRTAVAVAALMLAIAASVGLAAMIGSFRVSVARWLDDVLIADVYVSAPVPTSARGDARIATPLLASIATLPGIGSHTTYRRTDVPAQAHGHSVAAMPMVALGDGQRVAEAFPLIAGTRTTLARELSTPGAVMISEPLAYRLGLQIGDALSVRARDGWRALHVVAICVDFATERGVAFVDRDATYRPWWHDDSVSSLALFAAPGVTPASLADRVRQLAAASGQQLQVRSDGDLQRASLQVFDRTFAITGALRLLCLIVAFLGIQGSLMALQLDRTAEVGVLRALGALPRQVAAMVLAQTGLLGLCAGVLALPLGVLLGWLLVTVINRRSFGWTLLQLDLPLAGMAEAVVLAVVAALLAGLLPAWRFARIAPAEALREDA